MAMFSLKRHKKPKSCILLNAGTYSTKSFESGLTFLTSETVMTKNCFFILDGKTTLYNNDSIVIFNEKLIYNRFDRNMQFIGITLEHAERAGGRILNSIATRYKNGQDKIAQMVRVSDNGIAIPKTVIASQESFKNNEELIISQFSFPVVCKQDGKKGEQVSLVQNESELKKFTDELPSDELFLIQSFIPNTYDIRILMACGECIGGIKRIAKAGEFLNNVSQGGRVELYNPTKEEIDLAKKACLVNDTDIAGIDFIHDNNMNPVFIELNQGFGVEGFESVHTDAPVMKKIAQLVEKSYGS